MDGWIIALAAYLVITAIGFVISGKVMREQFEAGDLDGWGALVALIIPPLWPVTLFLLIGLTMKPKRKPDASQ